MKPLFMWAGGKTKVLKHQAPYFPATVKTYSEPFFGGGAAFLYASQRYNLKKVFINDVYDGIANIYTAVQSDLDNFCELVNELQAQYLPLAKPGRKVFYYAIRHKHAYEFEQWDKTQEAATLYFLLRTGFNGVLQFNKNCNNRFGTPSGLLNQTDKVYDEDNVRQWNILLKNAEISCGDYARCPPADLNYLDPPYRDSFTTYGTKWGDAEVESLLDYAKGLTGNVLLCNRCDGTDFFESRKGNLSLVKFPVTYTMGRKKKTEDGHKAVSATEILLYK